MPSTHPLKIIATSKSSLHNMAKKGDNLGPCPLCGRPLIQGKSVNLHHLVPKTYKGTVVIPIHTICHSKIHSIFTEKELRDYYHTPDRLREHEEIQKFIKWVRKQPNEYVGKNKRYKGKGRR